MATKKTNEPTLARVLLQTYLDGKWVYPNNVVEVTAEQLQTYASALDANPEAVAYAKSLAE